MITLVLGGARSGKSEYAEAVVADGPGPVTYVATAMPDPGDEDFSARITIHRNRRPPDWATVECGTDLAGALEAISGPVLVDSLGTWLASAPGFVVDDSALCAVLRSRSAPTVLVSEEVGMGVHPSTALGGQFRDALGRLNRAVSEVADHAVLVVAGRPLFLGPPALRGL